MKRVLFVVPSLDVGGTVSSLISIIEHLKEDYEINIFALSHDNSSNIPFKEKILKRNIIVHSYYTNIKKAHGIEKICILLLKVFFKLCATLGVEVERFFCKINRAKYKKYDTVIGFQEGAATRYVSYMQNAHKLAWVHCDYQNYSSSGLELHIYERFNSIICVSEYTASTFLCVYPSLCDKVKAIHNLMNISHIKKMSEYLIPDKRFDNSVFTIISVGRIDKVKRFEYIPEIACSLKQNGCLFKWYIIGPAVCQFTYNNLMSNIKKYNVEDIVVCLGSTPNPYPYFNSADLLVSLSYTEACPMIFNEAKILNLPILSTDFGSSYEFIQNGDYGIIVPFQKIQEVLERLIIDNTLYEGLKSNMIKVEYNNDKILDSLKKVLSN